MIVAVRGDIIGNVEGNQASSDAYRRGPLAILVRSADIDVALSVAQLTRAAGTVDLDQGIRLARKQHGNVGRGQIRTSEQ